MKAGMVQHGGRMVLSVDGRRLNPAMHSALELDAPQTQLFRLETPS